MFYLHLWMLLHEVPVFLFLSLQRAPRTRVCGGGAGWMTTWWTDTFAFVERTTNLAIPVSAQSARTNQTTKVGAEPWVVS